MATGVLVLGVNRATRLLGHLMLTEKGVRRHDPARCRHHAPTTRRARSPRPWPAGHLDESVDPRRARPGSSARSSRSRRRSQRSRSTASGPTSGSATVRRSSSGPGRSPSTSSSCTTSAAPGGRRRRRHGPLLQRHLHPRHRPRPRRRARGRRPPDRAAAYRCRPLRPGPGAHAGRAGRRLHDDADRRGGPRRVRGARARRAAGRRRPGRTGPRPARWTGSPPCSPRTAGSWPSTSHGTVTAKPVAVFV